MSQPLFEAVVEYDDAYVQPIILAALSSSLPPNSFKLLENLHEVKHDDTSIDVTSIRPLLQFRSYETIDFALALSSPHNLMNAYIIRKALIRKHYLSNTISSWLVKHATSCLSRRFAPAVDFELDYAEFLDDALLEVYELHDAFARNEEKPPEDREWWILKPSMSDRGQGIRLFSSEAELQAIFDEWEAQNPDSEDEIDTDVAKLEMTARSQHEATQASNAARDYITTSHLRHFTAQPYISNPLLFPEAPFNNRKFHIRTYVVVAGALRVYVYKHMLALFASVAYEPPSAMYKHAEEEEGDCETDLIQRLRDVHLTNTCVQSASEATSNLSGRGDPNFHVHLFADLPLAEKAHDTIVAQVHDTTAELFRAALAHPVNFQPLPQSFEVFGFDFLVSSNCCSGHEDTPELNAWLLEVNAFPDFAQTGASLRDVVVQGLFEEVVSEIIGPHFAVPRGEATPKEPGLVKVLDVDLQRR